MKKQMSLFVWAVAVFGMSSVWAATNSGMSGASTADLTGAPGVRARSSVNYEKYETRTSSKTYSVKDGDDIYYKQPAKKSDLYKGYAGAPSSTTTRTSERTSRAETVRRETKRKYYLAHPFFQPLKGKFGSVTDLSYATNSYDFKSFNLAMLQAPGNGENWNMTQFSVKEDLSFGITDRLSILGMAQFDSSKYEFKWYDGTSDSMKDSGVNLYGIGLQWRFVDNAEWIATLSGYYQRQADMANNFVIDLKGGYKVGTSTIYGLVRGWLVNFEANSYGSGITNEEEYGTFFIAYQTGDTSATYFEGGAGVFSVLEEDWTLNLEVLLGNYDWHNQGSIKGAIGWQPGNSFALNLYAKTSFYDSANDKTFEVWVYNPLVGITEFEHVGYVQMQNYSETKIGIQGVLYF